MTNTQHEGRLAGAAASLRRRVDRREVAWVIGTTAALFVAGAALLGLTASPGRMVATLLELPAALAQTSLVPFVVWSVLVVLVAWRWSDAPASRRAWLYVAAAAVARAGVELSVGSGVTSGLRAGFSLYTLPTVVFVSLPFVATVGLASFVVLAARSGRRGRDASEHDGAPPAEHPPVDAPAVRTPRPPGHAVHRVAVIVEALALAAGVLLTLSLAGQWFSAEVSLFGTPVTVSQEVADSWLRTLVACLACLVVALFAAITAGHRGVVVATVVVAGLVVIGAVGAPVPGDRWESPTPRQEPLPANYTPCFSGSGKCN
ncbi:hypothetical protein [Frigoribacterium sp. MEB024]|uniref:hypothetical protein n=1 Tax=Frigoribacterium sp. MEB024 TaxID=1589899 RepID=UPI0005BCAACB|nr:hypothetical protein [Frigoribacterium sp. MEB024]KIU01999.1 hypothetical protein SZ60_15025 [Frigoribacterium sp. MEB024]